MTLEALKQAIAELPDEEKAALATWLNEQEMDEWDRQMQNTFLLEDKRRTKGSAWYGPRLDRGV